MPEPSDAPASTDLQLVQARAALARARSALLSTSLELNRRDASDFAPVLVGLESLLRRFPTATQLVVRAVKATAWLLSGNLARYLRADRRRRGVYAIAAQQLANESGSATPRPPQPPAQGAGVFLVVDQGVCTPDQDAGSRTTMSIVMAMRDLGWAVWYWNHDRRHGGRYTVALEAIGVGVLDARWDGTLDAWLAQYGASLDHAMVMRPRVARDVLPVIFRHASCRLSYYGHDLHFARLRLQAERLDDPLIAHDAGEYLALERTLWRLFDAVLYPSEDEIAQVVALEPAAVAMSIPPYAFDSFHRRMAPPTGRGMLFVGGFRHTPNEEGLLWFVAAILPLVLRALPDAVLHVIGSNPTPAVLALAGPNVAVAGAVDDDALARAYDAARVVIAPLRVGAGVKGKVVEAMALGVPVVTTTVGAQGVVGLERIVPVIDDPADHAAAIIRLLTDDAVWQQQSLAQSDYAQRHFSRDAIRRTLATVL